MSDLSNEAANLNWLLDNFVEQVNGVVDAVVVSSDGLLMAMSPGIGRAGGDQLAAVASGLNSLTQGAARCFGGGEVEQIVVELKGGYMLFMSISDGSSPRALRSASTPSRPSCFAIRCACVAAPAHQFFAPLAPFSAELPL